jgi:DNA-binding response OmpR family regulator
MSGAGTVARIAVCPEPREAERQPIAELETCGYKVVRCRDGAALLERMADQAPDVLLYLLEGGEAEFALLRFVRRLSPLLPMILVARSGSLDVQRRAQALRPVYYAIAPLEGAELFQAVGAGLRRGMAGAGTRPQAAGEPERRRDPREGQAP